MSQFSDRDLSKSDEQKRQEIALFRYGLISPVIHGAFEGSAIDYFRRITREPLEIPHIGPRQVAASTVKSWLYLYRQGGLESLMPKTRCDSGSARVITDAIDRRLRELIAQAPRISSGRARDLMVQEGLITQKSPSETTLRRYIRTQGLRAPAKEAAARRSFAKRHVNELWTMDFMHGPRIKKRKTYLVAIIDDASRYIVTARFLEGESYLYLAPVLLEAIGRCGLPQALYCDNGAAFSSQDLSLSCARLEIALIHSQPYDPASRGKIERFFRTVRSRFLEPLEPEALDNLEALDSAFAQWLEDDYQRRIHSSLGTTPLEAWLADPRPKRWVAKQHLDTVFYRTLNRKVRRDGCVSIQGQAWEVGPEWVGKTVELRSPLDQPETYILFAMGEAVLTLHPLDPEDNDRRNTRLRFAKHKENS